MTSIDTPLHQLRNGGEMGALMRAFDWAATPLGPVAGWPVSLRTTVNTLLATRHAMFLWWGPALIQFYNDAYRLSLGPDRHPSALGQPGRECWAEIWETIGPEIEAIMQGGNATWHEDYLVPITRGDRVQDVYWSYSYSPVLDDDGEVGGVLVTVQETTRRIVSERRARLLQELGACVAAADSDAEVAAAAAALLERHPRDVAFAFLYSHAPDAGRLRLVASAGLTPEAAGVPPEAGSADEIRPVAGRDAVVLPLTGPGSAPQVHGVLIAGGNPRLPFDAEYHAFFEQMARELAAALQRVRARTHERMAVLSAARAERALLESVFKLAPSFLAVLRGPEHVFDLANPAYYQLVGHRPIIGRPVREALPEVTGQGFFELLDRVYRSGEPFIGNELAVQLQATPGAALEERFVNFVYQPMRDADGRITGILATGIDVSAAVRERVDAERVAAERDVERRQLLTVLQQSPVAIAVAEAPSGRIIFTNEKVSEIFGRAPADPPAHDAGQPAGHHLDGWRLGTPGWGLVRALRGGEIVQGEVLEVDGPDGRRLTIRMNAAPVRDAQGGIVAAVALVQDITAERRLEQQLGDAQRLQAVGTLAGGVAHEVNNQMTVVLGFGEWVLRALGPEHPQAADMRLVLQAGDRAARVSQQLLAFSRQQVTQPRATDLRELVAALAPVLRQLLGADKELVIAVAGEPRGGEPCTANVDPSQVEQVLINLVANARDAMTTGGRVTIDFEHVELGETHMAERGFAVAAGSYVLLSVSDTGRGMEAPTLARIFEPFFSTKPVGQGTGLGLSMVYGIVKQHGGYVWADSAPGRGTVMKLYWPALAETSAPSGAASRERPAARRGARSAGAATVNALVVEDEPAVRALAVRVLELEGFKVRSAEDGEEALRLLDGGGEGVDVLVTDIIMPHLNGRQLSDAIAERYPGVRVLFMSGHAGDDIVLRGLLPEGAPLLQKPFGPDRLARMVRDVLAAAPRRPA